MVPLLMVGVFVLLPVAGASAAQRPIARAHAGPPFGRFYRPVCGPAPSGHARCLADVVTVSSAPGAAPLVSFTPSGYGPVDLQSAYKLSVAAASSGATQTVAIVDAYDDPTAESDLAAYRAAFGLSACTSLNGCFRKLDQRGGTAYPPPDSGWSLEIALDVDMVSAICPNCHILLVEADDSFLNNLATAVDEAAALGATQISNSYGGGEFSSETSFEPYYDHPGIAVTAASGDSGYGVIYPAASQYVSAVGGTSLYQDSATARGWDESAWAGAGSGCSQYETKPSWQTDPLCSDRTVADVSAVADPNTGVAVYSTAYGGWLVVGGTSASSPIVASYDALIGPAAASPPFPYANPGAYFDITSGSNGFCGSYLCNAGLGYDGPTGVGTPDGANLGPACAADPTVTTNPANQTVSAPTGTSFTAAAVNSDPNCQLLNVQWQVSTDGGATFTNITGATAGTLDVSPTSASQSGNQYRAVFTNELGSTHSTAATLTVLGPPPSVSTGDSTSVTSTTATLNGTVGPNGSATSYSFQYSTSSSYGSQTPAGSAGTDSSTHSVSGSLSGLSVATTYHFRLIATNTYGTQYGGDNVFTTLPSPPGSTLSPHVTGAAVVGARLTVSKGAWAGSPDGYGYAWFDCPDARGKCVQVGANAASYVTAAGDLNGHIYAKVRAHNSGGWSGFVRSDNAVTPRSPVSVGHVKVAGISANVPLSCRGATGAHCTITLRLTVTETLKGAKLIAVNAAKKPKITTKVVLLGSATVTLRSGQSKTVKVTLGATGKRLLAQRHKMKVKLTVGQSGKVVFAKTLSFKAGR